MIATAKTQAVGPEGLPPGAQRELALSGLLDGSRLPDATLRDLTENHADAMPAKLSAVVEGRLEALAAQEKAAQESGECTVSPLELPEPIQQLVSTRDKYLEYDLDTRVSKVEDRLGASYAYLNALVFFNHNQYGEARERMRRLIDQFPQSDYAKPSALYIVETFRKSCDFDGMIAVLEELEQRQLGGTDGRDLGQIKYNALFNKANRLFKKERYADAAVEYERIVDENPDFENIHLALYNAGVAYETIKRYESAMRLYHRVYTEYNETGESLDALYRVGVNGERFFDFDTAVKSYLEVHSNEREHDKKPLALKRAGVLLKYNEDYERAAGIFIRYHDEYENTIEDAPDLLFEAALMYEAKGDPRRMKDLFELFRDKYSDDPKYLAKVLESYSKQGDHYRERGDQRRAKEQYERVLREHQDRGAKTGPPAEFAAKAQFMLADMEFDAWAGIELKGSLRRFQDKLVQKRDGTSVIVDLFNQVLAYKRLEWTMAALYRMGSINHNLASVLENAGCPTEFTDDYDACDGFVERLVEEAIPYKESAMDFYTQVVDFGKGNNIANDWTKQALNGLNDIDPRLYPVFEGERIALRGSSTSPAGFIRPSDLVKPALEDDEDDFDDDEDDEELDANPTDDSMGDEDDEK